MSLFDNLLNNLRVLSKVPEGGKIKILPNGNLSIQKDTMLPEAFVRTYYGDSQSKTINALNKLIGDCNEISQGLMDSFYLEPKAHPTDYEHREYKRLCRDLKTLSSALETAIKGVNNLAFTYKEFAETSSKLETAGMKFQVLIVTIQAKLDKSHEQGSYAMSHATPQAPPTPDNAWTN